MKITKQNLRRLIKEACGDAMADPISEPALELPQLLEEEPSTTPCPYSMADQLTQSGMTDSEILEWVNTLLSSVLSGEASEEFSYTGDVAELPGDEAFGIGYEAASQGL